MIASVSHLARAIVAGLILCAAFMARAADPVAFVSDFKGEVILNGAGRPPFLAELLPGSILALGVKSSASVMYVVSGEEFSLTGPGEFTVTRKGVKALKGTAPSIRTPGLRPSARVLVESSRTATASLRMRSVLPPVGDLSGPLYPVNARIATLQPTFRWIGAPDAVYRVVVATSAGKEVFRGSAKGSSLRLPSRLVASQSYSWSASAGDATGRESRFETLPAKAIAAAEKARAAARTFADRVLLALVLQDLDAAPDSREVWAQLAAERPDIPELAGLSR